MVAGHVPSAVMAEEEAAVQTPTVFAPSGQRNIPMAEQNGSESSVRYTSSHTPPAGYDALGRMFVVIVPQSLKVPAKAGTDYEAAIAVEAAKILKRLLPAATVHTVEMDAAKDSKHWARIKLDTPETLKVPAQRATAGKAGKMGEVLKAGFSLDKLYGRIVELKGSKATDGHTIDGQEAIKLAGAEQKMPTEMLYSFGLVKAVEAKAVANRKAKATAKSAK
jgi:hypothetical protein